MEQALRNNGLKASGVVSADTTRAYKPQREIFDEALKISGCTPGEVVHIGDSYDTDVVGCTTWGSDRCCFCGDKQDSMTTWLPQKV